MGREILRKSIRALLLCVKAKFQATWQASDQTCLAPLNRSRNCVVKKFQPSMHKRGLVPTSICKCGALDQTVAYMILECPLYCSLKENIGLLSLNDETRCLVSSKSGKDLT